MDKPTILAISNREQCICYKLEKKKSYYDFLFLLLKEFDIKLPDLYDDNGKLPDVLTEEDSYSYYENDNIDIIEIIEIIGHKRIFLVIRTNLRAKLIKFMEKNCEFVKNKRIN